MKKIHLATSAFPYPPGEQFLTEEMLFWGETDVELHLLPARSKGRPMDLPKNVHVELDLAGTDKIKIFIAILFLPLCAIFYKEIFNALRVGVLGKKGVLRSLLITTARTVLCKNKIKKYIKKNGNIDVFYCYWNDAQAYAACMLKRKGLIRCVVSRAHGGDLYEDCWPGNYMPLKRQFVNEFDAMYLLSDSAANYFEDTYAFDSARTFVSPLGILLDDKKSTRSSPGHIHVVSVAFCFQVKRIDRIIEAMGILSRLHPEVQIKWTHIGDGPLEKKLIEMSEHVLGPCQNLRFEFEGKLENSEVRQFYLKRPCDIFVNSSESEGMPVAIMEAMAMGVPTVAPDVGGISEMISEGGGILLSEGPTPHEIALAIWALYVANTDSSVGALAISVVRQRFNAAKNYPEFIKHVRGYLQ